jgi:hypothetical protein
MDIEDETTVYYTTGINVPLNSSGIHMIYAPPLPDRNLVDVPLILCFFIACIFAPLSLLIVRDDLTCAEQHTVPVHEEHDLIHPHGK